MTTLSIITPSFKQLAWLKMAVESVRSEASELFRVEHIVQDAGTPKIDDLISQEINRDGHSLRLEKEKDAGMYDAINRGLAKASGDICAWLNCDEQYLLGTLPKVVSYFKSHPEIDVAFGDALLVDPSGRPLSYRRPVIPNRIHTRLAHLGTLSCSTFFRRSIVDRGLLFDTKWKAIGDAVWMDRLLGAGVKMGRIPEPLAVFTFTGENLSELSRGQNGEHARWAQMPDAPPPWLRLPAILHHRMEKLLVGGYRKRDVTYEIFTRENLKSRTIFHAKGLGTGWPNRTGFLQT